MTGVGASSVDSCGEAVVVASSIDSCAAAPAGNSLQASASGGVAGILLDYALPNAVNADYTMTADDAQIVDSDIVWTPPAGTTTVDAHGYATYAGTYRYFSAVSGVPAKTTDYRVHQMWFRDAATPSITDGAAIRFNKGGSGYWAAIAQWNGGAWTLLIGEINPTWVQRASSGCGGGTPPVACLQVIDAGDTIYASCLAYDEDGNEIRDMGECVYNVASRPLKSEVGFGFGVWGGVNDVRVNKFSAWDMG